MKRVFIAAVSCAALLACVHRPASAMVEFCPAELTYEHVKDTAALVRQQSSTTAVGETAPATSSLYGIELGALGARSVTAATLAFDTDAGWYTADVPSVDLVEKNRHYSGPSVSFVRHDWISPIMYVRFPKAAVIAHAWVYSITVKGDALFGWDALGSVTCPPPPAPSAEQRKRSTGKAAHWIDPRDEDRISDPPSPGSLILRAKDSMPLENASCDEPFRDADVVSQARPDYPFILRETFQGEAASSVQVALQPDGSLRDAWIWGPSGFDAFDNSALHAATATKYSGARSYCQAVPSKYLFRVTYDSRS